MRRQKKEAIQKTYLETIATNPNNMACMFDKYLHYLLKTTLVVELLAVFGIVEYKTSTDLLVLFGESEVLEELSNVEYSEACKWTRWNVISSIRKVCF